MIARTVSEPIEKVASPPFAGASGYRLEDDRAAQHYAAIVESSEDAILSKDLDGVITSWNNGAERLFGYAPGEVVGRSVTILIPSDRENEEPMILERIRRGERIEHYETVRRRKDGSLDGTPLSAEWRERLSRANRVEELADVLRTVT